MTSSADPSRVIETERLTLRPYVLGDYGDMLALWSDPVVTRFIGGKPHTSEEVWQRLMRYAGMWELLGHGSWAVCDRNGAYVGDVGVMDGHRIMTPSFDGALEVGWSFMPAVHGRGYAQEAVTAAIAWAEARFDKPLVCMIDTVNAPSLKLAEKLGFREKARSTYRGEQIIQFQRVRP